MLDTSCLHKGKIRKNLEVKEGLRAFAQRGVFSGTLRYITCYLGNTTVKEYVSNILMCCLGNRLVLLAINAIQSN